MNIHPTHGDVDPVLQPAEADLLSRRIEPRFANDLPWRKARASSVGNCLELAPHGGLVAVRDSKDPQGPVLVFTKSELSAFLVGVRNREFDDLAQ